MIATLARVPTLDGRKVELVASDRENMFALMIYGSLKRGGLSVPPRCTLYAHVGVSVCVYAGVDCPWRTRLVYPRRGRGRWTPTCLTGSARGFRGSTPSVAHDSDTRDLDLVVYGSDSSSAFASTRGSTFDKGQLAVTRGSLSIFFCPRTTENRVRSFYREK